MTERNEHPLHMQPLPAFHTTNRHATLRYTAVSLACLLVVSGCLCVALIMAGSAPLLAAAWLLIGGTAAIYFILVPSYHYPMRCMG